MKNLVKFYREKHEITQEDFAQTIGISRQSLHDIETRKSMPRGITMLKITREISRLEGKRMCCEDIFLLKK